MSRAPSEKTQLIRAKRQNTKLSSERNELQRLCLSLKAQVIKAESEVADWKTRFDLLLKERAKP